MIEEAMSTCVYKNAAIIVKAIFEYDKTTFYFENPTTGKWCEDISEVFIGWEDLDPDEKAEWDFLKDSILTDKKLRDKMYNEEELIDYTF